MVSFSQGEGPTVSKKILYAHGIVTFDLPGDWEVAYQGDQGIYGPLDVYGVMRLRVDPIYSENRKITQEIIASYVGDLCGAPATSLKDDISLATKTEVETIGGQPCQTHLWIVGVAVSKQSFYTANFEFAVPLVQEHAKEAQDRLKYVDRLVRTAKYSREDPAKSPGQK